MAVRVNKYLSEAGFCSRREADRLVEQGRIYINGKQAVIGDQINDGDAVEVDGEKLSNDKKRIYIAFNKPVGVTCTTDPKDKTNIVDYVNHPERIFNIGRLDKPSEGLIFLTNDGNIVNKILRAGNNHEKEYVVSVDKKITAEFASKMSSGVRILGTLTKPCKFTRETETRFRIILTQGLNRQIRRMCEVLGYNVIALKRVRVMNITLSGIAPGQWRYFTPSEIERINELIASSVGTEEASEGSGAPKPTQKANTKKSYTPHNKPKQYTSHMANKGRTQSSGRTNSASSRKSSYKKRD